MQFNYRSVTEADKRCWDQYIKAVFSKPETAFTAVKYKTTSIPFKLDLHGMSVQQAFYKVSQFVDEHFSEGNRTVIVVTGKSGKIADEFLDWCKNLPLIRRVEPIIDSQGETGAWILHMRKSN